jgi:hypothetical protein
MSTHRNPVVQKRHRMTLKYMRIIACTFLALPKNRKGELQICEDFYQRIFAHSTKSGFENSILVEKNPSWLRWNVVFAEDQCSSVIKIVKGQRMAINEFTIRTVRPVPGHTNDADFSAELFADLLDRGGFSIASASTRCPKPKSHRTFGECGSQ